MSTLARYPNNHFGINVKKLCKYNDLYHSYVLKKGDVIYLKKKNRKTSECNTIHVISSGESMHCIKKNTA